VEHLQARDFPEHVVSAVGEGRWEELEEALRAGLPATLYSQSYGMSLFEFVLIQQEGLGLDEAEAAKLPLSLLQTFLQQHRSGEFDQPWLSLALGRGQWSWGEALLDWGWPAVEGGAGPVHALVKGVLRHQQLNTLVKVGQLFQDLLLPLVDGRRNPEELDGEIFFKHLASRWASIQASPLGLDAPLVLLDRLVRSGAELTTPLVCPGSAKDSLWPIHRALASQEPGLVWGLLEQHERQGIPLPPGVVAFAVGHATIPSFRSLLSHGLVQGLPESELAAAAFASVGRPLPGALVALEAAGLDLVGCRDGEGWDLMQRAAQQGCVSALLVMAKRGPGLEEGREVGPTPGDLLRLNHPQLCEALGVEMVQETPKVRVLRPR